LNTVNDEAEVTCTGSVFQMRAPATGKAREPMEVSRTAGTIRTSEVEDRRKIATLRNIRTDTDRLTTYDFPIDVI